MRLRAVVLTLLLAASGAAGASQAPAQSSTGQPQTGTGLIVGQVVDAITGRPVPEAIVTLNLSGVVPSVTTPHGRVMADDAGRYFFGDLPAGSYYLGATKEGFYPGSYGRTRPTRSGPDFVLGDGQARTDARISLWKLSTITGTVVDEVGEPVIGVTVQALSRLLRGGRPTFNALDAVVTDDRGIFRIASLAPGDYIVGVPSMSPTFPVSLLGTGGLNPNARFAAVMVSPETVPLGNARAQQFGDLALMTQNGFLVPPVRAGAPLEVYRSTYHPATFVPGDATVIAMKGGDERTGIDITLKPVAAVRVSGKIVGPDGAPTGPTAVRLASEPSDLSLGAVQYVATALSDASGAFTLLGVPSGRYMMRVETQSFPSPDTTWAAQPLTVGSTDVANLIVQMKPVLSISGRVEFRSATGRKPPTEAIGRVVVERMAFGGGGIDAGITPQGTFSLVTTGGPSLFRPRVQPPWYLHSVMVSGRDVSVTPIDLQGDISTAVIVLTDTPARVSGVVRDARGSATAAEVVAFPTDPARWVGFGNFPAHFIANASSSATAGTYSIVNLPAGEYFIAALTDLEGDGSGGWAWAKNFEAIAPNATRIKIAEGEQKTMDLVARSVK